MENGSSSAEDVAVGDDFHKQGNGLALLLNEETDGLPQDEGNPQNGFQILTMEGKELSDEVPQVPHAAFLQSSEDNHKNPSEITNEIKEQEGPAEIKEQKGLATNRDKEGKGLGVRKQLNQSTHGKTDVKVSFLMHPFLSRQTILQALIFIFRSIA